MKTCPYCAEEVLDAAIKCKHCGSMLPAEGNKPLPANPPQIGIIPPPLPTARAGYENLTPEQSTQILNCIKAGNKINATKLYHEFTRKGLNDSKDVVEQINAGIPAGVALASIPTGMTRCRACNELISKDAKTCPKCGKPQKKGGCFRWGCGSVLLLLGLAWMVSDGMRGCAHGSSVADTSSTEPKKTYVVGDKVSFSDSEWIVESAQVLGYLHSSNEFVEDAKTAGKFIKVQFKVKNTTQDEQRIMTVPRLVDSAGRQFQQYDRQDAYLSEDQKSMAMESIPAGMTKTFFAIYELPTDSKNIQFETRALTGGNIWTGVSNVDHIPVAIGLDNNPY